MGAVEHREVTREEAELRLDRWFKQHYPGLAYGKLQKLLREGQVRVDGKRAKAHRRLEAGGTVRVPPAATLEGAADNASKSAQPRPSDIAELTERILYKDESVLVLDKPAGMPVQGGTKQQRHLDAMLPELAFEAAETPRLVHRLDKDTSGCLVLARKRSVAMALGKAFRGHGCDKIYWALTSGVPTPKEGRVNMPLAKQPAKRGGERVQHDPEEGKTAVTDYRVLDRAGKETALVELRPRSGRTHQLRAHAALALNRPVLGDLKYGEEDRAYLADARIPRQLYLHARRIVVPHPDGGEIDVTAPLPDFWQTALDVLALEAPEAD